MSDPAPEQSAEQGAHQSKSLEAEQGTSPEVDAASSLAAEASCDPRVASWEISRTIECLVEALDLLRFSYGYTHATVGSTVLAKLALSHGRIRIAPRVRPVALIPLQGTLAVRSGRAEFAVVEGASAALLPAGHQVDVEVAQAGPALLLCEFEADDLIRSNADVLDRPDSDFIRDRLTRGIPSPIGSDEQDSVGARILTGLVGAIDAFAAPGAPPIFPELESCVLRALYLVLFPSPKDLTATAPPQDAMDPRLRRLCARMLDSLSSDLKLPDLARETGLSIRSIQYLFERHLGLTPKQWIIEQRLLAVRARLSQPRPNDSVTSIAIPFFNNLGHFAQRYHRRFGEKPSQTLARARAQH